jgi:hypothetical protein
MLKKIVGAVLMIVAIAAMASGLGTLLPAHATQANDLGYKSLCPFAPWSTLILLVTGGVMWVIRQYILTRVE